MIACVSPSDSFIDESLSTLNYAVKAGYISNEPVKNFDPKTSVLQKM
jgi:kinesin family protein 4/21/27